MMSKKVKIGVLGGYRGTSMIKYCKEAENAEIVAICDNSPEVLESQKRDAEGLNITFYDNFDEFILHDMDAVVLANYATEHAPFAITAMKLGKHDFSEVTPMQTMKEAVELLEAVEETGMIYAYGENYCYMPAPYEMKKLYAQNKIGEFEYGECEYIHNCEPIWPSITYGIKDHWRNNMYSTFYCTHSLGPIIHATGLRPVSVIGIESKKNQRREIGGGKGADMGMELVTLENGAIVKSIHGGLYVNSVWYSMYGSKGRMESAREETGKNDVKTIFVKCDMNEGDYAKLPVEEYRPTRPYDDKAKAFGHGSSDFYCMWHFVEKIKGNPEADIIDVYEAMDMFLPGLFAFRSILNGSTPTEIPNLRNKAEREAWRNDTACTDPNVAGDMLLPTRFGGTPDIPDAVYEAVKKQWDDECSSDNPNNYRAMIYKKGEGK